MSDSKGRLGLFFDLDGTLVDSASQILSAANFARATLNQPLVPTEFLFSQIGLPAEALFSDLELSQETLSQLVVEFRNNLLSLVSQHNKLYPSVESLLGFFKSKGHFLAIATSKPTYLAESVVRNSPLSTLVDTTLGSGVYKPKPDPEILLKLMQSTNLSNVIMFGDRVEDIQAAIAANIRAVGIAQTTFSKKELIKEGAFLAFESFVELEFEYKKQGDKLFDVR